MTNKAQAKLKRNETLDTLMDSRAAVFATDAAMKPIAVKFKTDCATAIASSIIAETDNSGYSAEKHLAKDAVSATAAALSANCQVKLDILGNIIASQALNGTLSYYTSTSDALCSSRLMSVHNSMLENLTLLTPDYLTEVQLTAFLVQINTFSGLRGTSSLVIGGETVNTKQAAADLKVTDKDVVTVKKVALKYKKLNLPFYNEVINACRTPNISVHHTPVEITVTDSNTNEPLGGVSSTFTKSKEIQISNPQGIISYLTMSAGNTIATLVKKGYISKLVPYKIIRAQMNSFSVSLTSGTMTAEQIASFKLQVAEAIAAEKAATAAKLKSRKAAKAAATIAASEVRKAETESLSTKPAID